VAGLAWWRLGRGERSLDWLPLVAAAAWLTAGVEVSKLVIPVKPMPGVAPWLGWDLVLGSGQALLVLGLATQAVRGRPGAGWRGAVFGAGVTVAAVARHWFPAASAGGMSVMGLLAVLGLIRAAQIRDAGRIALLAVAGTVLFATNGPLAETLDQSFRHTEASRWSRRGVGLAGRLGRGGAGPFYPGRVDGRHGRGPAPVVPGAAGLAAGRTRPGADHGLLGAAQFRDQPAGARAHGRRVD
jgi:hypothetical protein